MDETLSAMARNVKDLTAELALVDSTLQSVFDSRLEDSRILETPANCIRDEIETILGLHGAYRTEAEENEELLGTTRNEHT